MCAMHVQAFGSFLKECQPLREHAPVAADAV